MAGKNYYKILGLPENASKKEIKKKYKKLAKKYHPDVNKDPGAKERFIEINEAYEILIDDKPKPTTSKPRNKRQEKYDKSREYAERVYRER